jgi:hypothetical protein
MALCCIPEVLFTSVMSLCARLVFGQRFKEIPHKILLNSRLIFFRHVRTNIMM